MRAPLYTEGQRTEQGDKNLTWHTTCMFLTEQPNPHWFKPVIDSHITAFPLLTSCYLCKEQVYNHQHVFLKASNNKHLSSDHYWWTLLMSCLSHVRAFNDLVSVVDMNLLMFKLQTQIESHSYVLLSLRSRLDYYHKKCFLRHFWGWNGSDPFE